MRRLRFRKANGSTSWGWLILAIIAFIILLVVIIGLFVPGANFLANVHLFKRP